MAEALVVTLPSSDVDIRTAHQLGDGLISAAERAATFDLVIDMTQTRFIDSVGFGMLMRVRHRVLREGGSVRLLAVRPNVAKLIELPGLAEALPVVTTHHPD